MTGKMDKRIQVYCASCDGTKHHKKLFAKASVDPITKADEEYAIVQCLGCGVPAFLLTVRRKGKSKPDQFVYPYDEEEEFNFLNYEYKDQLPRQIRGLYDEIKDAFEADSAILAGVGLRALVEAVCIDQKIPGQNLLVKIQGLHGKGFVSAAELPILDKLRLIGNISAHEIKSLPMDKLELALSIINHVLTSIYILPKINKRLKLTARNKTGKKKGAKI